MGEKLGKILKEREPLPLDGMTSAPVAFGDESVMQQNQPMQPLDRIPPQGYPPQPMYPPQPQGYPMPPQGYPPYPYPPQSAPWNNPDFPYNRTPMPPQGNFVPSAKPAIVGDAFKLERVFENNRWYIFVTIAIEEKFAKFNLGKIMVSQ